MGKVRRESGRGALRARMVAITTTCQTPLTHSRVVARRGAPPARPSRGTRQDACSGGTPAHHRARGKGFLERRVLMPQGTGQLSGDRIGDHHRRQLAAGDHIWPDRHDVGRQVIVNTLVEPLVTTAEKRDVILGGKLRRKRVVELAPRRARGRPCAQAGGLLAVRSTPTRHPRRLHAAPSPPRRRTGSRRPARR